MFTGHKPERLRVAAAVAIGLLRAATAAGSKPGRYVTTFALAGGDSVSMTVDARAEAR